MGGQKGPSAANVVSPPPPALSAAGQALSDATAQAGTANLNAYQGVIGKTNQALYPTKGWGAINNAAAPQQTAQALPAGGAPHPPPPGGGQTFGSAGGSYGTGATSSFGYNPLMMSFLQPGTGPAPPAAPTTGVSSAAPMGNG